MLGAQAKPPALSGGFFMSLVTQADGKPVRNCTKSFAPNRTKQKTRILEEMRVSVDLVLLAETQGFEPWMQV